MSQDASVEAAVRQGSADYFRDADAQGGAYGEWVKGDRSKPCPQILNGDIARYIARSVVATLAAADRLAPDMAETPHYIARRIVCEEWHQAVKEFGLTPNSVTEKVVSSIINRLDRTPWPAPDTAAAVEAERERCEQAIRDLPLQYSDAANGHVEVATLVRAKQAISNESSKQYQAAVDRVNRATDAEIDAAAIRKAGPT